MSNESPPGSSRPSPGGEFTWPPTSDELDAIHVIKLDDPPSRQPIVRVPEVIAAAPIVRRRRLQWHPPRREDVVYLGITFASALAISVAAVQQLSDWRWTSEPAAGSHTAANSNTPIAPLVATAPPATSPAVSASSVADVALLRLLEQPQQRVADTTLAASAASATPPTPAAPHKVKPHARRTPRAAHVAYVAPRHRVAAAPARLSQDVDEDYRRPRLISPEYGRNGKLVLLVEVRKNGKVGDVDVLSSNLDRDNRSHRDLQRAAISTVKRWRYTPAIRDGEPADTQIRVVVDINLDSARAGFTEANARRRGAAANRAADTVLAAR